MSTRKRVLVTGGAGFIGSRLSRALLERGHEVICLDNFFSGSKDNIRELVKNTRFELLRHDVTEPILLEVDEIYNLACPASPIHYQLNPVKTVKTNVLGTLNMLGLAKRVKAKFLQASTSEVYGDPKEHPQREKYWGNVNPVGLRSCYDEGKRVAETLAMDYHRQSGVDVKIVRIFNTYGPQMNPGDGRVIPNFIMQALESKPLTVYGKGDQTRSFMYVDDLVRGMILMMEYPKKFTGPMNLGNPREHAILEIAQKILSLIPRSRSAIVHKKLPPDDPKRRQPDITLAKQKLGWQPKINLEEGLLKTIAYFKGLR